jgi:hypothetical protein
MNSIFLKIKFACLLFALILSLNCGGNIPHAESTPTVQHHQFLKLNSGKQIRVNRMGKKDFPYGQSSVYVLEYETDVGIYDIDVLRKEADEIWETIQIEVEKLQLSQAVIHVTNYKSQGEERCKSYGFGYLKLENGEWDLKEYVYDCRVDPKLWDTF